MARSKRAPPSEVQAAVQQVLRVRASADGARQAERRLAKRFGAARARHHAVHAQQAPRVLGPAIEERRLAFETPRSAEVHTNAAAARFERDSALQEVPCPLDQSPSGSVEWWR